MAETKGGISLFKRYKLDDNIYPLAIVDKICIYMICLPGFKSHRIDYILGYQT